MSSTNAVIFDLDGVIVSTDELHYRAWLRLAGEEGIPFDRTINDRLRGLSRMASLAILLEQSKQLFSADERTALAERKNEFYRGMLGSIGPSDILPGVAQLCSELRSSGIRMAIGSSSKNARQILRQVGLSSSFDAVADGNDIRNSKPDPEVFILTARRLGIAPANSVVVEDATSGVSAAVAGGFRCFGVGFAARDPRVDGCSENLRDVSAVDLLAILGR